MKGKELNFKVYILIIFSVAFLISPNAWATPSADFLYGETNLGGGLWKYDYTLYNISNPSTDLGYDLFSVAIDFQPLATFTLLSIPIGWDAISGAGFAEAFSLNPGTPPIGADIAPGTSLSGFSFQFDYQAGNLPFLAYLINTNDPANPIAYAGNTAPVPEPATFLLLASGLAGLGYLRGRKLFKA